MTKSVKLFKTACIIGAMGLILLFAVIFSKAAYPDLFFKIAVPLGLGMVFLAVVILGLSWVLQIKQSVTKKDYMAAVIWFFLGLFVILIQFAKR